MGTAAAVKLRAQGEALQRVDAALDEIESNVRRANKQVRAFIRRMGTDKLILVLVLLVAIGLVVAVVVPLVQQETNEGEQTDLTSEPL